MQINFQNNYSAAVNVAIAYYDTSCSPPWQSEGWWGIDPGNSVYVINTCNRYLYFYAEAVDGEYWAGQYLFPVAEGVFYFCPSPGIGFSGDSVGMRQIDNGIGSICWPWDSFTIDLNP
jgi:uncharacterized membrane protein